MPVMVAAALCAATSWAGPPRALAAQDPAPPPRIVQPGAPGQPTREIDAAAAIESRDVRHTDADVAFMQGMLAHHAQAVEMTKLVADRTSSPAITKLAARIAASQADEIAMMQEWLRRRAAAVPDEAAHHHGHPGTPMPGMLTPDEMARLRDATGTDFDARFLEGMIRHHEGALVMVRNLLATPGAGQEPELYAFVADVEADQGMEIRRMRRMRGEMTR